MNIWYFKKYKNILRLYRQYRAIVSFNFCVEADEVKVSANYEAQPMRLDGPTATVTDQIRADDMNNILQQLHLRFILSNERSCKVNVLKM